MTETRHVKAVLDVWLLILAANGHPLHRMRCSLADTPNLRYAVNCNA